MTDLQALQAVSEAIGSMAERKVVDRSLCVDCGLPLMCNQCQGKATPCGAHDIYHAYCLALIATRLLPLRARREAAARDFGRYRSIADKLAANHRHAESLVWQALADTALLMMNDADDDINAIARQAARAEVNS